MSDPQNSEEKEMKFDLEVAPIESITRAEIDTQIATARQYPRSLAQFYKRAEAMITSDQDPAESCFYQIRRKDSTQPGGFKLIEGESIRMAEIVAANFGNLRSAVHISGHTATRVSVRAVCHDLETNNLIAVEKQAKTTYKDGSPYNEDMAIVATNALVSKALRDAIFRVVPKALIKPLKEKAKLVAFGTGAAFNERRHKAILWATATRKVPADRVYAVLGVKGEEDMTIEHLEVLTGLKNAIMEGDQTVDEAFPPLDGGKPIFEHPEKKKQDAAALAGSAPEKREARSRETVSSQGGAVASTPAPKTESKVEPKPEPKKEPEIKKETTPPVVEPKQEELLGKTEPATTSPEADGEGMGELANPNANEAATTPAAEEAPKPVDLTPEQAKLRDTMIGLGHSFEDMMGYGKASLPYFKTKTFRDWSEVPSEKAVWLTQHANALSSGIKSWKGTK